MSSIVLHSCKSATCHFFRSSLFCLNFSIPECSAVSNRNSNRATANRIHRTAASFNRMLGRSASHPGVKEIADRHFSVTGEERLYEDFEESSEDTEEDGEGGDSTSIATGAPRVMLEIERDPIKYYTPEELSAMLLSYSTEITKAYIEEVTGQPIPPSKGKKPKQDAVLTVPMFYTQQERVSLTKSAALGGLNVLSLIEVSTNCTQNCTPNAANNAANNVTHLSHLKNVHDHHRKTLLPLCTTAWTGSRRSPRSSCSTTWEEWAPRCPL